MTPPELNDYEHFWQPLTNPDKDFSFGAVRFSRSAELTAEVELPLTASTLDQLTELGFCGVHFDLRGFEPQDRSRVMKNAEQWMGPPVASGREGDWQTFLIP